MAFAWSDEDFPTIPTRMEVEAEIEDWRRRLNSLFDLIEAWCAERSDVEQVDRLDYPHSEFRLREVGIPDRSVLLPNLVIHPRLQPNPEMDQDSAALSYFRRRVIRFATDAVFVGGTRGNVGVWVGSKHYRIADFALHGPVEWVITPKRDALTIVPFTKEEFFLLLDDAK